MKRLLLLLTLALALALAGCGSDKSTGPDTAGAQQEVEAGNQALASGDYAGANTHFKNALAKDPNNLDAQLGAAVTEVYLVQDDPAVADLIALLGPQAPVRSGEIERAGSAPRLAALGLAPRARYDPVSTGRAMFKVMARAADDPPSISQIQNVIKTVIMTRLQYAEDRLNVIEGSPGFVLRLPPALTELPDTLEVDVGDVYLLDATINTIQGWLGLLVAYNFDLPSYEHVNAESLLSAGTDWATLHPDGASQLASARLNLLRVNDRVDRAVTSINAETDPQDDDLFPQVELATQDFADFLQGVANLYQTLSGRVPISGVEDYQGQPFALDLDLGLFFTAPIADIKTKLPAHDFDTEGEPYLIDPLTFGDPTFNGIFPDMTNARWQQLVGPVGPTPPPVARR